MLPPSTRYACSNPSCLEASLHHCTASSHRTPTAGRSPPSSPSTPTRPAANCAALTGVFPISNGSSVTIRSVPRRASFKVVSPPGIGTSVCMTLPRQIAKPGTPPLDSLALGLQEATDDLIRYRPPLRCGQAMRQRWIALPPQTGGAEPSWELQRCVAAETHM